MKYYKINNKSKKQSKVDRELIKVYKEIDEYHYYRGTFFCSGCGRNNLLSHSHTIPRSRRPDLITDKANITLKCHTCHTLWETHSLDNMKRLLDFDKLMAYIEEVDQEYYNLLMLKEDEI